MMKAKRSKLAQSRIDYIVYGNPREVSRLIYDYGYAPPKSLSDLSDVVHELINLKGRKIIMDLVKLHPDRDAILGTSKGNEKQTDEDKTPVSQTSKEDDSEKTEQPAQAKPDAETKCPTCGNQSSYDSFCGCNHSYDSANDDLPDLSTTELRKRFIKLTEQSEENPQDKKFADEATKVWNEIRLRNQSPSETMPMFSISKRDGLLILVLTILAGILIGYSSRTVKHYAKS